MRLLNGNVEVVAPISAPILQIVAMPVQERDSTPGPLYSTMAPVPPFTVRIPATFKITSTTQDFSRTIQLQHKISVVQFRQKAVRIHPLVWSSRRSFQ